MSDKTSIEWTDATWNPIRGCSRVSAGCQHCYAEGVAARFSGPGLAYEGLATRVKRSNGRSEARWTNEVAFAGDKVLCQPMTWSAPRKIFVNSMSDLFHENVPDEIIDRIFAVMALCPQHTFQILTKRPERMRAYLDPAVCAFHRIVLEMMFHTDAGYPTIKDTCARHGLTWAQPTSADDWWPLRNVWLGVSVENQDTADERIPLLLQTPAAKRFISAEPLLGPVDLVANGAIAPRRRPFFVAGTPLCKDPSCGRPGPHYPWEFNCRWGLSPLGLPGLDWLIAGGESGNAARAMHPDWARSLRDQCAAAGVPFFFKQWGEWVSVSEREGDGPHHKFSDGATVRRIGKRAAGRSLDGVEHNGFPA